MMIHEQQPRKDADHLPDIGSISSRDRVPAESQSVQDSSDGFNLAKWREECEAELKASRQRGPPKPPARKGVYVRLDPIHRQQKQHPKNKRLLLNVSLRVSEALFADPSGGVLSRDSLELGDVLCEREEQLKSAARQRRQQDSNIGRVNRKEASAWRSQQTQRTDPQLEEENPASVSSPGLMRSLESPPPLLGVGPTKADAATAEKDESSASAAGILQETSEARRARRREEVVGRVLEQQDSLAALSDVSEGSEEAAELAVSRQASNRQKHRVALEASSAATTAGPVIKGSHRRSYAARGSISPRGPRQSVTRRVSSAHQHKEQQRQSPVPVPPPEPLSDLAKRVRTKVRLALQQSLPIHRRRTARLARKMAVRKACVQNMADDEATAEHEAFDMYADQKRGALKVSDASLCLAEFGLHGRTRHERQAVDKAISDLAGKVRQESARAKASALDQLQPRPSHKPGTTPDLLSTEWPSEKREGSKQAAREGSKQAREGSKQAPEGSEPELELFFEDFSAELVPAVRHVLLQMRQQHHFEEFTKVKTEGKDTATLEPKEFQKACSLFGIDPQAAADALELALNPIQEDSVRPAAGSRAIQVDFDTAHEVLLSLQEKSERTQRRRERALLQAVGMSEDMFWRHRTELLRLDRTFHVFDADHSGLLSYGEVKLVMKKIGLQPFRPLHHDVVEEVIRVTDLDGNGQLDFCEFLHLIDVLRAQIMKEREGKLTLAFKKHVLVHQPPAPGDASHTAAAAAAAAALADGSGFEVVTLRGLEHALAEAGVPLREKADQEFLCRCYEEFENEDGGVGLQETHVIAQKMFERRFQQEHEKNVQYAASLGMDIAKLAEHQWIFDQLDIEQKEALSLEEVMRAVKTVMKRPPKPSELQGLAEQLSSESRDGQFDFRHFLHLMHLCDSAGGIFGVGVPYTLDQVSEYGLLQLLNLDETLSATYASSLGSEDLVQLVAGFLGCEPSTNLREWNKEPIANFFELFEYAKQCQRNHRRRVKQWEQDVDIDGSSSGSPGSATNVNAAIRKLAGAIARGDTSQSTQSFGKVRKPKGLRFALLPVLASSSAPRRRTPSKSASPSPSPSPGPGSVSRERSADRQGGTVT